MGISGELYNLLQDYLSGMFQRVVLNEQTSSWGPFLAGVREGSIPGLLIFSFNHFMISLNNIQIERVSYQKHFGIILDEKLNFRQYR